MMKLRNCFRGLSNIGWAWVVGLFVACAASGPVPGGSTDAGSGAEAAADGGCGALGTSCQGDVAVRCTSAGAQEQDCAAEGLRCIAGVGCRSCLPGAQTCENGVARACDEMGASEHVFECDALQGMSCEPDGCKGACTPSELGQTYVGCDYWPTISPNFVVQSFTFAVAVANTTDEPATLSVTRGDKLIEERTIAGKGVEVIGLPWIEELKGFDYLGPQTEFEPHETLVVKDGAYRLRATRPMSVYQLSPLEYELPLASVKTCQAAIKDKCLSFSNDASLLLPSNALRGDYVVTGYKAFDPPYSLGEFVTVTATQDATTVQVTPTSALVGGPTFPLTPKGQTLEVTLDAGDVLRVMGDATTAGQSLSGTQIVSTDGKPVLVLSGHPCNRVPNGIESCDHLEEVVLPVETWGKSYVVAVPLDSTPGGRHTVRLHAASSPVTISFQPESFHTPVTLAAYETLQVDSVDQDFSVKADTPFAVSHYMHGQKDIVGSLGAGDPSQSVVVSTEQYRMSYRFFASKTYAENYVTLVTPKGASLVLDGQPVDPAAFEAVNAQYQVARVPLTTTSESHFVESTSGHTFGLTVHGYGQYTSYMYPGGMALKLLEPVK